MTGRAKNTPGLARVVHLIARLKTDMRLARDATVAEGLADVRALLDGIGRNLRACAEKAAEREGGQT